MAQDQDNGAKVSVTDGADDQHSLTYVADGSRMILPDQTNLLYADFARRGGDLLVGGADRPALVILDYFTTDQAPDLMTEGGAVLAGQVIAKLAGPNLERSDQAVQTLDQDPIGHVENAEGEVIITRADGSQVIATKGTPIYQDDVITTDSDGAVGLRFIDGMTLSLGSDARMVLDEFVYNPEAGEGGGIIEIIQGAFSFISGEAAHMGLDSLMIDTPTMTIGIRGTKVVANAAAEGETTEVVLLPEDDGTIGKIMITTDAGQELLENPFVSTTVTSRFLPPASQSVVTPDWVYSHFSKPLAALPAPTVESGLPDLDVQTSPTSTFNRLNDPDGLRMRGMGHADEQPLAETETTNKTSKEPSTDANESESNAPILSKVTELPVAKGRTLLDIEPSLRSDQPAPDQPAQTNEAPVVVTPIADTSTAEDAAFSYDTSANFADDDSIHGDTLTFGATLSDGASLPTWLTFDPATGILSGTPLNADIGTLVIDITATDSASASITESFQLTVNNSNDTPVVVTPIADTGTAEDAAFSYDVSANFSDIDSSHGDTLVFSATQSGGVPLPAWLAIDPATGVLSGTPANADVANLTIDVTATDSAGAGVVSSFQLAVNNSNDTPVVVTPIADTGTAEDAAFSYDVSASFADDDSIHGDTLAFGATLSGGAALPAWLTIDPVTGILSGTPINTNVGALNVDVTATDATGASISASFQLTVSNSNDTPVIVTPIVDTNTAEDAVFSYDVSASFADDDSVHGDTLTFSAEQAGGTPLPAWLTIDPATGILSGTPLNADVDTLTLTVSAIDSGGAGVSASFQLTINNANDAPVVVTPIADATPVQDVLFNYDVSASFADDDTLHGDTLTFSAELSGGTPLPSWLSIDPTTGVLSGTPDTTQVGIPFTITVTATDDSSAGVTSTFQLSVDNVNDAPVLSVTPSPALTAVAANATNPTGNTIADIIVDGSITDPDGGAVEALALTSVDDANGTWEFSIDIGDNWTAVGTVSDNAALLLDGTAMLRFVPDPGFGASANFTFRAWDQTTGSNGQTGVDVSTNGGTTAFSLLSDTGSVSVQGTSPDLNSGAEFQVNTTTADKQELPSVAALADGGYVVTWQSHDQDGDHNGIFGQRYDSTGSATGSEFQINTTTASEQEDPAVAGLAAGGFVVTWKSKDQDGDNWGVYGQRYDNTGSATGSEFQINTTTAKEQQDLTVAPLGDGGFVVTWESKDQDGDNWGIYGQRYDNTGSAVGSEFQINTTTTKEQRDPSVAALDDGGFVVTWESKDQDGDNWGVYGQRYDSTGSATGSEFQINTTTANEQKDPWVAALDDGGFVVTWQSKDQDGDNWGIYGQRYDSAGDAVEFEFQINQETSKEQQNSKVSALADGGFIVTWDSKDQDGDNWGVYGRRFNADGDPLGSEFQINTTSTGEQKNVATAALDDGGLAVAWQSKDQDGDNWGVYGHRYDSETASVTVNPPQSEAASTLDFGGSNSFVDIGDPGANSDDLDPGRGDYTVEGWFYYDGANGTQSIVSKGNDNALDAGFNIFLDDDTLVVRASTDGGLDSAAMKVTMTGSPGWHHVAMVLDQENGTAGSRIKGYLDGSDADWTTGHGIVFSSTVTTSTSRQIQTDERFLIGAVDDNGTAEDFFDSEIADVRVWNTARSQAEIQADLGRALNGDEPHLLANWQLDDGVGSTASDSTGNGYDGTLSNTPSWQDATNLATAQDTTLAGRLSASDLEGDTLVYSVAANGANGTASIDADKGSWSYDPDAGFSGSDSFSYQISDGNGGNDTVTIAVTVSP